MLDDNMERGSVAETSYPLEENYKTPTPSVSTTREIASGFWPENKAYGMQSQRSLTNLFPEKNITYKNKVVVQELFYYTYDVIVPENSVWVIKAIPNMPLQVIKILFSCKPYNKWIQKTLPFRNLITSATDSLSSLISFSNCDNTTLDYIMVHSRLQIWILVQATQIA